MKFVEKNYWRPTFKEIDIALKNNSLEAAEEKCPLNSRICCKNNAYFFG